MRLSWGTAPLSVFDVVAIFLTLLCVCVAFVKPDLGRHWLSRVERFVTALSSRLWICAIILFLFPILLRLLLLPVYSAPVPFISDEYAYLLQSDTLALGRLANPVPALAQHFASVYVLSYPTYSAEYQIGQGAVLALGQVLTGSAWAGVIVSMGLLCALTYWALLAWLPAVWAFTGTLVIVDIQLGVLSYWMNSYWGGCVPAIGGTLALGALIRLRDRNRVPFSFLLAAGLMILMNSRPLEGLFLTMVAGGALLYWTRVSKQLSMTALARNVVPPLVLGGAIAVTFAGYYNQRITGHPTRFPYLLYRDQYGLPQGFFWQKPVLVTTPLPADIRAEYENQLRQHERRTSFMALVGATGGKIRRFWEFYVGVPLTVALLFLPSIWRARSLLGFQGRNMGLAVWALAIVLGADNLLFFAYFPHYSAAVMLLIVLVLIQCIRAMRASGPAGLFLSRSLPLVCALGLFVPMCGRLVEGFLPSRLARVRVLWNSEFFHEVSRERFVPQLERLPGKQLVLVRYRPYEGDEKREWIYNRADFQTAKIIWARDSEHPGTVRQLLREFPGRKVWLAEPDEKPSRVLPYPETTSGGNR